MRILPLSSALLLAALPLAAGEDRFLAAYEALAAYRGPVETGVDTRTLDRKVMCGYQGWFRCPDDGSGLGWQHYKNNGKFEPGHCSIDLWPDLREFDEDEKHPTVFRHKDGAAAHVFSSLNRKTVGRHFRWMKEYGIDGVFVQRFASITRPRGNPRQLAADNRKLLACREAANKSGRAYALMYDLSGLADDDFPRLHLDWKLLRTKMRITDDPAYLRHNGRPLVAVWGVGFKDSKRAYSLEAVGKFVRFLKDNPEFGKCSVMLGVPTGWRTLSRDARNDPKLHEILKMADVVSPWTVGRYRTGREVERHAGQYWKPDGEWCRRNRLDYLPVVFPGFSWHNLHEGQQPLDQIPRRKGAFFWKQVLEARGAGARMLYVAMFDEIDEGTAIFKCTNDPPVGKSPFLTYEGLPSDHYLKLAGQAGRLIRGEPPRR